MKKYIRKAIVIYKARKKQFTTYNYELPFELIPHIGKGCLINRDVSFEGNSDIEIGDYTYINGGHIYCAQIGKYCSMGYGISIGPGEHNLNNISTFPISSRVLNRFCAEEFVKVTAPCIGNDVWVGNNAVIMQGVSVGNGAVIAAGAIVTKDVPPYAIVAGVPAKIIRFRFTDEIIEKLQRLRWWDKDVSWIEKNVNLFHRDIYSVEDLNEFIE
ncbi:CatB-related O-acetyltransferase [Enterococcus cecorum]|uniref:CatB-related O-acetyltransferase n=1 Tax=Enterococcus cecorum TaxID=44008 RepID=UPI00064326C0|nr:CatB-related O-acetyltransferase [Enterococcus cecorum]KLO73083.1 hypothetical protein AA988_01255 [Enterococcus cecorum]CAI3403290.1 CatB-related O-acetyltransferase [Enterococcus cecorum]